MERIMMNEHDAKLLSEGIAKLTDEEQDKILGGTADMVSVTDEQCTKIKRLCMQEGTPRSRQIMTQTNYGCCCPRQLLKPFIEQKTEHENTL